MCIPFLLCVILLLLYFTRVQKMFSYPAADGTTNEQDCSGWKGKGGKENLLLANRNYKYTHVSIVRLQHGR